MDELDRFVLTEDLPERGLRAGDLGTIVMVHDPDGPRGITPDRRGTRRSSRI
ncbi:MAG: DUF4926 domain-containing protein [Salinibacter sp.]